MEKQKKILIIDDENSILTSLEQILIDEKYTVVTFSEPLKAIEDFRNKNFDLVLLDIWMPDIDGLEILEKIKKIHPHLPVIIISGHLNISSNFQLAKKGAEDFLEKPFSREIVLKKVNSILEPEKTRSKYQILSHSNLIRLLKEDGQYQKTISSSQVLKGKGLHTGVNTGIIISPMPEDTGIVFEDISTGNRTKANIDYVGNTSFCTKLSMGIGGESLSVVEHLLAAINAYSITNMLVKVNNEIPIMDGSSKDFCHLLELAKPIEQKKPKKYCVIEQMIEVRDAIETDTFIKIEPYEGFFIDYTFQLKNFGNQHFFGEFHNQVEFFKKEVAPSRTFGFVKELKQIQNNGLAKGGDMSNFLMVDKNKVLNQELLFENEFARHKVLDIIGDMALLGYSIKGKITARHSGHRHNIELVKKILQNNG